MTNDPMTNGNGRPDPGTTADAAWAIVSYLLGGMLVWGGVGWLIDRLAGTSPVFLAGGVILGICAGMYSAILRINRT